MSKQKDLKEYTAEIGQCVKCGACQAHCPVFGEQKKESVVARGKVALAHALLEQEIELDERMVADMSKCLLCGSCFDKCPNLVPTDEIVMATRREIAERKGLTTFGKAVSTVLKNPALMNLMAKGGKAFSRLLFKAVPEQSGLRLRLPLPFVSRDRTLPTIADKPELEAKYNGLLEEIHRHYRELMEAGIPAEDARFVLPNAATTKIVITMNARELKHFFNLRCCRRAQWEIQIMAKQMLKLARKAAPLLFATAGPGCLEGPCPEGKMTCGEIQAVRQEFSDL